MSFGIWRGWSAVAATSHAAAYTRQVRQVRVAGHALSPCLGATPGSADRPRSHSCGTAAPTCLDNVHRCGGGGTGQSRHHGAHKVKQRALLQQCNWEGRQRCALFACVRARRIYWHADRASSLRLLHCTTPSTITPARLKVRFIGQLLIGRPPKATPLPLHLDMPCRGGVAQQQVLAVVVHRQLRGCEDGGPNSCRPHAAVQGCQPALMPAVLDIDGWSAEAGGDVLLCRLCRLCRLVTALQMAGCHVAPAVWQLLQMHALNGNTNKQRAPAPAQPDRQHPVHTSAHLHICAAVRQMPAGGGRAVCATMAASSAATYACMRTLMRSLGVAPAAPMAPAAPPAATFFHRGIAAAAAGCWPRLLALLLSGRTSRDLIGSYAPYRIVL